MDQKARDYVRRWKQANKEKVRERHRQYYEKNRERIRAKAVSRREANPEKERERHRKYRAANVEKLRQRAATYRAANTESEHARSRKWQTANPERVREIHAAHRQAHAEQRRDYDRQYNAAKPWVKAMQAAGRRALKSTATPKWLTAAQRLEIKVIYAEAARLGLTVDHIVPLKGKTVCGLHVPWNLQLLTSAENSGKCNRLEHHSRAATESTVSAGP